MPLCLFLRTDLTALFLVDAMIVNLMLFGVHVLGSVVDDITCVIEQVAYADYDLCVEIIIDRSDRFFRRLVALLWWGLRRETTREMGQKDRKS